jgi:tRNA (cmo5U34)-methyltransferase
MTTWQFDHIIAKTFVAHARRHIPNYDLVIDKSVALCKKFLDSDSAIVDVGCATGETLNRLSQLGYKNLTGIDNSQAMLDHCSVNADLICSDQFPDQMFDAILCNWTLHFVHDKMTYLQQMFKNLTPGGFMVLSEKTSLDPVMIDFYHELKSQHGVSDQEIASKATQVKDIMFINDIEWYLKTLKLIGFDRVQVIDANWCFTSFFCQK